MKYDDIPDPYAVIKPGIVEESKSETLQEVGRHQKSGTVFKKKEKEFFDSDEEDEDQNDFEWGNDNVRTPPKYSSSLTISEIPKFGEIPNFLI